MKVIICRRRRDDLLLCNSKADRTPARQFMPLAGHFLHFSDLDWVTVGDQTKFNHPYKVVFFFGLYFVCFNMFFYNCSVIVYSTSAGHKSEINLTEIRGDKAVHTIFATHQRNGGVLTV